MPYFMHSDFQAAETTQIPPTPQEQYTQVSVAHRFFRQNESVTISKPPNLDIWLTIQCLQWLTSVTRWRSLPLAVHPDKQLSLG